MEKTRFNILIFGGIVSFILISGLINVPSGLAAPTSITLQPVKFLLDLSPGQIWEDRIFVVNPNDFEIILKPEAEDFVPAPGGAGINFIPKAPGITSLVDWIDMPKDLLALKPNEQREINFKINVPEKVEPGSHFAAIFFKTQPLPGQEGTALMISTRIGSLVLVTIPGEVARTGELIAFKGPKFVNKGPVKFLVTFRNTGSVHYQVEGAVIIKNIFGKETTKVPVDSQWILPTGQKTLKAIWDVNYLFGFYTALLEIKDGAGNKYQATHKFFAMPWKESLAAFIGFIMLVIILRFISKRFRFTVSRR